MRLNRIPLAWKNLTHQWRRLAVAISGIAFAVTLMFMEVGFENALYDSTVKIVSDLDADIVLVSTARYALPAGLRFPRARMHQAMSVAGVTSAWPIYTESSGALLLKVDAPGSYPIRVIGVPLDAEPFEAKTVGENRARLMPANTALIDVKSKRKNFRFSMDDPARLRREPAELLGKRLNMVGTFRLGTDFAHDGNLLMSDKNFARYFPFRVPGGDPLSIVDIGVLQVETPDDRQRVEQIKQELQAKLPDDVFVFTKQEYIDKEIYFWQRNTPIGLIFKTGVVMGIIVGVIICYQIIYSDIASHMKEFATLKAMGYTTPFFVRVVIAESVYLSALGFVPGLLLSAAMYSTLASYTGLLMRLTMERALTVLVLTLLMCIISGALAIRKLLAADPAELF